MPQWGTSNEYPQHTFLWRNKKNVCAWPHLCDSMNYIPVETRPYVIFCTVIILNVGTEIGFTIFVIKFEQIDLTTMFTVGTLESFYKTVHYYYYTVFDLITAHIPISAQSSNSVIQITASVLFVYFFIKAYVVGTHLNCIDLSMQFKCVPTTYAFIQKIRKRIIIIK